MTDHAPLHRWLAAVAALLGLLALGAGDPYPAGRGSAAAREVSFVTAIDVARLIRDGGPGVRIADLRPDSLFAAYHVPGAERIGRTELASHAWSPDDQVVLYAEDDATAIEAAAVLERRGVKYVRVLRGGLLSWVDQIVEPRLYTLAPTATSAEQAARREQLELSRYFGGTPFVAPGTTLQPNRASEAAAVARMLRRGC
jgi:rhodanese-related sulfurtransferase